MPVKIAEGKTCREGQITIDSEGCVERTTGRMEIYISENVHFPDGSIRDMEYPPMPERVIAVSGKPDKKWMKPEQLAEIRAEIRALPIPLRKIVQHHHRLLAHHSAETRFWGRGRQLYMGMIFIFDNKTEKTELAKLREVASEHGWKVTKSRCQEGERGSTTYDFVCKVTDLTPAEVKKKKFAAYKALGEVMACCLRLY